MPQGSRIQEIFSAKDTKHGLSLFSQSEVASVEKLIDEQNGRYVIKCQKRDKYVIAKPEEIVRQLWLLRLMKEFSYPKERIDVEKVIQFGTRVEPGAADIVIYHEDLTHYYILFEVKRPSRTAGLEQLKGYCNAEGAPIGVWSNGNEMIRLHREEPNIFIEIPRIPSVSETLRDILTERWTLDWLDEHDELRQGKTTLKKILLDLEELVLGNAGVDPFDEIFKLIYSKLFDEWKGINNPDYQLEFFVGDRSPSQVKTAITNLLKGSKRTWSGVFEPTDWIDLTDDHTKVCVSFLEKIKLFNSNLRIIDEAFEYLIPQVSKKKEGQFFTPRPVEDMTVRMLNPKQSEFVIDPACGSAGFLLHSVMWIAGGSLTGTELPINARNFAQNNIVGVDFAKKVVRIAKAINLIVGDGRSHIFKANSLAPQNWSDETKAGLRSRLLRFPDDPDKDQATQSNFDLFDFDVLMTNPPFAGTIKERDVLRLYKVAEKNGRMVSKIGRHILFIERSVQFLRPGGRLAIVLPQGLLNNPKEEYIRRMLIDSSRILAVVSLHVNTFKPHTGTKTSVLFLQKYTDDEYSRFQELLGKYEIEWTDYLEEIQEKFDDIDWDSPMEEGDLDAEALSFINDYFGAREELNIEEDQSTDSPDAKLVDAEDGSDELRTLASEFRLVTAQLSEKEAGLKESDSKTEKKSIRKEITGLKSRRKKLHKELLENTLAGQLRLLIADAKINVLFKKAWIDGKLIEELDHPIFMAVNEKPLKDSHGDYNYLRGNDGELLLDKHGHPLIEHDLDVIADAFVDFAKAEGLGFWTE